MNNKKLIISFSFITILFVLIINVMYIKQNNLYKQNYNSKINEIVYKITLDYKDITKKEIMEILNGEETSLNVLKEYGISLEDDFTILKANKINKRYLIIINITIFIFMILFYLIIFLNEKSKRKKLNQIINLLENINNRNYMINIEDNEEGIISLLKNEIYKTMIMLKEETLNSYNDKLSLKNSLEDISHQLKTPLTSISIMLDNLIDNDNLDDKTKKEFLITCQKEIDKINFLIKSLLKLSRFDVNVVKFNNKNYKVTELINKVIDNVSILCDLKNIKINVNITNDYNLCLDLAWQVEALTNIVKNCIEHSNINGVIDITCSDNKVYSKIEIKDYGTGINKEDLNHIFERFYKGKNTSSDGVGIGLSLAKTIIETNNGKISVTSKEKCYTIFEIKYFK